MKLEIELQEIIDDVASDGKEKDWGDGECTKQIKSSIAHLGKQKRYWVYASQAEHVDGGEWLYDLTWLNYSDDQLLTIELALESEWDQNGIIDDFQKLLIARAELRAMIFQVRTENEKEMRFKQLREQIGKFTKSIAGDRYLFSCWVQESRKFSHETYIYQPIIT